MVKKTKNFNLGNSNYLPQKGIALVVGKGMILYT